MTDASITGVVLPTIAADLDIDDSQVVLVATSYPLILAMLLMPMAALGDRIGHRRLYRGGLVLHGFAAILCLLVDSLPELIAARSLQAVGTAASLSVVFGLLRMVYPAEHIGRGVAVNAVANISGTSLAPAVGGLIVSLLSWRWVFTAMLPFSILVLLCSRVIPESIPQKRPFDTRGAVLCAATFGLLIIGLEVAIRGPGLWVALPVLSVGLLVAWWFVRHEMGESHPVLPINLLARWPLALAFMSSLSAVLAATTLLLFMPFRLQNGFGFSPGEVGGLLATYAVASASVSPLAGYLSDRVSVPLLCTLGAILVVGGLFCLSALPQAPGKWNIIWRLWLCGAGFSLFFSPNVRFILGTAPVHQAAAAGSMVSTTRMFGQAMGASMVAGLLALGFGSGSAPLFVSAFLITLAGLISLMRLLSSGRGTTEP